MRSSLIRHYIEQAVRCPSHARAAGKGGLRVAATLLTCEVAASVLNEMAWPPEPPCAYRYVNVHNPHCALRHDARHGGWHVASELARHPVWGLNWFAAAHVCAQLGGRLPEVAEWRDFASAGDSERIYPWGNTEPTPALANYDEHYAGTVEVGRFAPNPLGLYDLAGNLEEWCQDACPCGAAGERMVKGGAWSKGPGRLRIAASRGKWERLGTTTIGVRPVWDD